VPSNIFEAFSDPQLGRRLLAHLRELVGDEPMLMMEVCGTHTVAVSRAGLRSLIRPLELRSGPGCPVCVTDDSDLAAVVRLAKTERVTVATYGDMLRVPSSAGSLAEARAAGADVRVVYSALEGLKLAQQRREREVVLVAVGFETTAPGAALAARRAVERGVSNFSMVSLHKLIPPALQALLSPGRAALRGLLLPGHVSTVIGSRAFEFLSREFALPAAVAGFEPLDILGALITLVRAAKAGHPAVYNCYRRAVRPQGNPRARALLEEVFRPAPARWRGLGVVPDSGLVLREEYSAVDAARRFGIVPEESMPAPGCRCGEVLLGRIIPPECPLFGNGCTPGAPRGPCMVSSEGSCQAYYRYERGGELVGRRG